MSPFEKTIIVVHPALPEPLLDREIRSKATCSFLPLPLLGQWSCTGVEGWRPVCLGSGGLQGPEGAPGTLGW